MASSLRIAKRYAVALMNTAAAENQIEQIRQDLASLTGILDDSRELRSLFRSPVVQYHRKLPILREIFEGKISPLMLNFLLLLASKRRESIVEEIADSFISLYNERMNLLPVSFISAVELNEALQQKLIQAIAMRTGKKVLPEFAVNPELKGGIIIRVADTLIDGSVRHQLALLHRQLAGSLEVSFA
jgi:F-type H+-transporting ATPase subunit delta